MSNFPFEPLSYTLPTEEPPVTHPNYEEILASSSSLLQRIHDFLPSVHNNEPGVSVESVSSDDEHFIQMDIYPGVLQLQSDAGASIIPSECSSSTSDSSDSMSSDESS
ncbi:hypothetical protein GEMRC1_003729 [Eukaryota sp. GEM-RC1]